MKKLLLLWIFSGSLDSFSQDGSSGKIDTAWWVKNPPFSGCLKLCLPPIPDTMQLSTGVLVYSAPFVKPDTLRAICMVTLGYRNLNTAHARMGYVVIELGKEPVYLDCRKRPLRLPQVGWGYREVKPK